MLPLENQNKPSSVRPMEKKKQQFAAVCLRVRVSACLCVCFIIARASSLKPRVLTLTSELVGHLECQIQSFGLYQLNQLISRFSID